MTDAASGSPAPPAVAPATASAVQEALGARADPEFATGVARFFQTGPGQYAEGDVFLGLRMPVMRSIVESFTAMPQTEIDVLLDSEVHEHRTTGLLLLVAQFEKASKPAARDDEIRTRLAAAYLAAVRRGRVNNWDLVDCSAPTLVGAYLFDRPRDVIFELADSEVLWHRRVAMVGTLGLITRGDASTTLQLAARLLGDRQPLMHKAVGWMLREVGRRIDKSLLLTFLDQHAAAMPRTALSYATEHLSPEIRAAYRALR